MARKTKLTAEQKKILKLVGWEETQEDGAVLMHPNLPCKGNKNYLWEGETFKDAMTRVKERLDALDRCRAHVYNAINI